MKRGIAMPGSQRWLVLVLIVLCLGAISQRYGAAEAAKSPAAARPNLLLVLSDDQSYPHVGCYGNPDIKTPNLDRFASEGLRCDRAYVSSPQCVCSRAGMMTCRSPVGIGMTRFSAPLAMEFITYPEVLRGQGYFTGVAGRTYHLDGASHSPEAIAVNKKYGLATFARRLDYVKTAGKRNDILSQYREFLDTVPQGKPFFLQLCFNDPHRPLDKNAIPVPHDPAKLKLPPFYPDTPAVRADFARYYDEISRFDGDFGTVMAELDRRGLSKNTLVMFMGDNGASQLRGKGTLNELGIHVPLLVRWPGVLKPGSTTKELISGEDLGPTYLEAAGIAAPKVMTGHSFAKLLRGEALEGRKCLFSVRGPHGSGPPLNSAWFDLGRCVVTPRYKLIYNALWQIPFTPVDFGGDPFWKELQQMNAEGKLSQQLSKIYFSPTRPMYELYDLEKDPHEMNNLDRKPGAAAIEYDLKCRLMEWMTLERDYLPLPIPDQATAAAKGKLKRAKAKAKAMAE